ncbi:hypothetical protein [Hoeflea sp.]|uniref:hypothetical protein n=1 Tax=Hoeflea sp. TaxID=1940281 RepID=UPI001982EB88|nr:hypothetical protein [Hoeflea sp.]MBC7281966.1 hypothetical protein [Hoeflea sp.]
MTSHDTPSASTIPNPEDQVPDYALYRNRAHQERSLAIRAAFSGLWRRVRTHGPATERDARYLAG